MAEAKTQRTQASVPDFLDGVADASRRADAQAVCALRTEETGEQAAMWGSAIGECGEYAYH